MSHAIAAFLYPFVLFVLGVFILTPARRALERHAKPGKLKDALITRNPVVMTTGVILFYVAIFISVTV